MRLQGKQIMRTTDNLSLLYMSPYAYVEQDADGIFFTRTDEKLGMRLEYYPSAQMMEIFRRFLNGIEQEKITELLQTIMPEAEASELLELLLQKGVVE